MQGVTDSSLYFTNGRTKQKMEMLKGESARNRYVHLLDGFTKSGLISSIGTDYFITKSGDIYNLVFSENPNQADFSHFFKNMQLIAKNSFLGLQGKNSLGRVLISSGSKPLS